jgi:tyrosine ammonia-lyase
VTILEIDERMTGSAVAEVPIDGRRRVTLEEFWLLSEGKAQMAASPEMLDRLQSCRRLLEELTANRRLIYGVTTGFGPLATQHIDPELSPLLQRNLIYHLATGVGAPLSVEQSRGILAARLLSLSRGHSAIRVETFLFLMECLNRNVIPVVPSQGTVGASGDLTPLAHVALGLLGEGTIWDQGRQRPAADVLAEKDLQPLALLAREGLAMVNGTSAMTAIAARNGVLVGRALEVSARLSVLYAEVLRGKREAYSMGIASVRPHPGQIWAATRLEGLAGDSTRLACINDEATVSVDSETGLGDDRPILQDPYTIRCAPQILGAVRDLIRYHNEVVETELNSVTDNPIFFPAGEEGEAGTVRHGGNFFGLPVALASDALHPGVIQLALTSERRIARLCDPKLNGGLPAFLQARRNGLQSGLMGAQVTASALVAEMRSDAGPASIQSIPTNNNNQDVVPMGTIAARKTQRALDNLFLVLAIEAIALAQAVDELAEMGETGISRDGLRLVRWVRQRAPRILADRSLAAEITAIAQAIAEEDWSENRIEVD